MVLNKSIHCMACLALLMGLAGCSVTGPRESPLNEVTRDSPSVLSVYRGSANSGSNTGTNANAPRDALQSESVARPLSNIDAEKSRYWDPLQPLRGQFARVPNPDLVMVVFPHLTKGKYPVPGYVTTFPMYTEINYALPGEVESELIQAKSRYAVPPAPEPAKAKAPAPINYQP